MHSLSVFVSLHYMMYLITSENQALIFFIFYFLQRGEEYLLHFPPSVKGAYSILSIHSIQWLSLEGTLKITYVQPPPP
uniref:Uncharacterized protein n=1 Tax=Anser cygnoides TaxID=8845 RepID=A0A8B9E522_ANSCY